MSKIKPMEVTCPACGLAVEAVLYESLNAERLPHLVDPIVRGEFEVQRCAGCGATFQAEHGMLYSNLPRGLWVVVAEPSALGGFQALEDEVEALFAREFAAVPAVLREAVAVVRPRVVFGQRQLAEAVRMDLHGLPAALVECAKLELLRLHLERWLPLGLVELVYTGERPGGAELGFEARRFPTGELAGRVVLPKAALAELAGREADYRASYPALFERPFVNALRYFVN